VPATSHGLVSNILTLFDCTGFANDAELFSAMNTSHLMLWATGPDDENIHVNPWMEYWTGRTAVQFQHGGWIEVIHPDDRTKTVEGCREGFRTRQPFPLFYRLRRSDGVYYPTFDYAQPRFLPDGRFAGYVGSLYYLPPGASMVYLAEPAPHGQILLATPSAEGARCS
jgi:hypothetical protein